MGRGINVTVVTTFWNKGPPEEEHEGARIVRVPDTSTYFGRFASLADTHYWSWGYGVARVIGTLPRPDVIHCITPVSATPALAKRGWPVVTTFHHFEQLWSRRELLYKPFHRVLEYRAYHSSTLVNAPSRVSRDVLMKRYGLHSDQFRVTPWGVDLERFRPVDGQTRSGSRLLFVGGHEPRKGLPDLLKAVSMLRKEGLEVHLTTVGGGEQLPDLRGLASRLGVSDRVHFLGHLPDSNEAELPRIYSEADVFVFPSAMEGFGLVLLEAMASGLPVVASRASAIPEVVGDAGVLVPPGSPRDLAAAVGTLLRDTGKRRKLGKMARQRAETHFSWGRTVSRLLDVYKEAIEMTRGGGQGV